ncbi:DUF3303 family protein [Streptacidiphilus monticola]|uniref:DUF3303 family protein n=1 Tax=Streptacidiphilus monticola TaxID=2161674 RepID=A0ABW1G5S4_9ACTN
MRMLMIVQMDTGKANQAIRDKRMAELMQSAVGGLKPEAAYFTTVEGCRGGYIVFDLKEPAQLPSIAEPFFLELDAKITYSPVMTPEDVIRGLDPGYVAPS